MMHGQPNIKISLLLSARMQQHGSHRADFYKILYMKIFRKSVEKIEDFY